MLNRVIAALVCFNLLAGAIWGLAAFRRADARQREILRIGQRWEEAGLMPRSDYVELRRISDRAVGRPISDRDLDWLLAWLGRRPNAVVAARVAGILQAVEYSPPQRDRVVSAALPLLSSGNPLERQYGATLQGWLGDPRAVARLLPLVADTNPYVRAAAERVLRKDFGLTRAAAIPGGDRRRAAAALTPGGPR